MENEKGGKQSVNSIEEMVKALMEFSAEELKEALESIETHIKKSDALSYGNGFLPTLELAKKVITIVLEGKQAVN